MTLRHLEIFMSVYHQKSITKAAKELHISQPSVSLAIKELEEKYQTILFDRMNRQIYPTEKACLLYNHSMQILSSLENMENEMYNDQVKSISFGCSMTLSQVLLPHFLKTLKEKYPTIDFHINVNNLKEIENQLLKNEIDFALIETLPLHQLHKIPFYQDELVIIVSKKHPLLKTNNLKELENYDYYSREKGSSIYELVQSYFISYKLDIHPSIECVNPSSLIELVRYNNGFTILPSSLVKNEKEIALIKNKDFYIQRTYHIVMHKDKKLSSIYQEIFELIKNYSK
ncbi:LysR family transcriptional regulator [Coprobacillus sp. AF21-8LB]|nr:LysR family transcriptional regulator [Coprobacillus sp. AF21-8LB]